MEEAQAKKPRALVVEDVDMLRRVLGKQLKELGFVVSYAVTSQGALAFYGETNPFDVVFMDHLMKGSETNGAEAAFNIRKKDSAVCIICLTATPVQMQAELLEKFAVEKLDEIEGLCVVNKPYKLDCLKLILQLHGFILKDSTASQLREFDVQIQQSIVANDSESSTEKAHVNSPSPSRKDSE
ncbi:MAG TPA: response regulator [Gammaproteobacteria bacterium]|nr:response regulator [Gammaproteobacteria bacterium]